VVQPEPGLPKLRSGGSLLAAQVARKHFLERRTNLEIAGELGISRFRVARLLDQAIDSGIVQIAIAPPIDIDDKLSTAIRDLFGLKEALVLPPDPTSDETLTRAAVAQLAARYLADLAVDGMTIGISWGKTLDDVAAALETGPRLPTCHVVQMVGNLPTLEDSMHAGDVLRRFSNVLRGHSHPLHAPLIANDAAAAEAFRAEPSVARTLAEIPTVDVAVVGIGSWDPPSSRLMEVLPKDELRQAKRIHPVADVCAVLLDDSGDEIGHGYSERRIGATRADLAAISVVIGVASGTAKTRAIRSALRSGLLSCLVVDAETAAQLLTT